MSSDSNWLNESLENKNIGVELSAFILIKLTIANQIIERDQMLG